MRHTSPNSAPNHQVTKPCYVLRPDGGEWNAFQEGTSANVSRRGSGNVQPVCVILNGLAVRARGDVRERPHSPGCGATPVPRCRRWPSSSVGASNGSARSRVLRGRKRGSRPRKRDPCRMYGAPARVRTDAGQAIAAKARAWRERAKAEVDTRKWCPTRRTGPSPDCRSMGMRFPAVPGCAIFPRRTCPRPRSGTQLFHNEIDRVFQPYQVLRRSCCCS